MLSRTRAVVFVRAALRAWVRQVVYLQHLQVWLVHFSILYTVLGPRLPTDTSIVFLARGGDSPRPQASSCAVLKASSLFPTLCASRSR